MKGRVKTVKTSCFFTTVEDGKVQKDALMDYIITDNYLSFYPMCEAHYNKKAILSSKRCMIIDISYKV
jgi:hypothetical protein